MNEIKKPKFKSEDLAGKWKELVRYLYATVDELNWNLLTLQNKQQWQAKRFEKAVANGEDSSESETNDVKFKAKLKRTGATVSVIVTGKAKDGAANSKGSIDLILPKEFFATFYDPPIPIHKTEKMAAFLEENKITIDYEFENTSETIGAYFQYISTEKGD